MQKNYIFKSRDGKEMSMRGTKGMHKMAELQKAGTATNINNSGLVISITTTFETYEEMKAVLKV